MKTAVVPAQITTVEDKITSSLSLSQVILLTLPVFFGGISFIILPPSLHVSLYKLIVCGLLALICGMLALRIKGTIVLNLVFIFIRYVSRPKYFVFTKQSPFANHITTKQVVARPSVGRVHALTTTLANQPLSNDERLAAKNLINSSAAQISFKTNRKGRVNVLIT